jgi:hypothetical protein
MQKQYILNRKLNNRHKQKQNELLSLKIQRAKSSLDLNCPESFTFFKTQFKEGLTKNKCNYFFNISYIKY